MMLAGAEPPARKDLWVSAPFGQTWPVASGRSWRTSLVAARRAVSVAVALGFVSSGALADHRHRVVLLEQPNEAEASTEVLARVRGELTAAGFEVVLLPATIEGDPASVSETTARELHPAAVIFVLERPAEGTEPRRIELWLSDRLSRRTFVQSLPIDDDDAGRGYRRLAIQAVELLKARLAELSVTRMPDVPPPAPKPPRREVPKPPPAPKEPGVTGRLAGGVALLQGFEGVEASWAPRARLGASIPMGTIGGAPFVLDLGGTLVALGSASHVRARDGEASVGQGLGTADLALRFNRGATLQPVLSLGAGVYSVSIAGTTDASRVGTQKDTWSLFTSVGTGVWLQPAEAFAIELEGQVGRAWSKTIIQFDGPPVAETGSPLLLLSVAAVGVF
jgi:hypothetical protein